ncbi:MAG: hypothetical protein HYS07_11340 [Chlamydiae bacterium]|nr:hypothetical protein [Chlamydiota bacterium]MBI3278080.1 hypothetical protein [Chlamydiota bacterium]
MNCRELPSYWDDDLRKGDSLQKGNLWSHLDECSSCRRELMANLDMVDRMNQHKVHVERFGRDPNDYFMLALRRKIQNQNQYQQKKQLALWVFLGKAEAVLIALLVVGQVTVFQKQSFYRTQAQDLLKNQAQLQNSIAMMETQLKETKGQPLSQDSAQKDENTPSSVEEKNQENDSFRFQAADLLGRGGFLEIQKIFLERKLSFEAKVEEEVQREAQAGPSPVDVGGEQDFQEDLEGDPEKNPDNSSQPPPEDSPNPILEDSDPMKGFHPPSGVVLHSKIIPATVIIGVWSFTQYESLNSSMKKEMGEPLPFSGRTISMNFLTELKGGNSLKENHFQIDNMKGLKNELQTFLKGPVPLPDIGKGDFKKGIVSPLELKNHASMGVIKGEGISPALQASSPSSLKDVVSVVTSGLDSAKGPVKDHHPIVNPPRVPVDLREPLPLPQLRPEGGNSGVVPEPGRDSGKIMKDNFSGANSDERPRPSLKDDFSRK